MIECTLYAYVCMYVCMCMCNCVCVCVCRHVYVLCVCVHGWSYGWVDQCSAPQLMWQCISFHLSINRFIHLSIHLSRYSSFYSSSDLSVYLFNHQNNLLLVTRRVRMSVSRRSSASLSRGRAPSVKPEDESKSYSYANLCRDLFRNPNNSTQFSRKDLSQPLLKHTADSDKEVR